VPDAAGHKSWVVHFGMRALSAALSAQHRRLTTRDRLNLAEVTLAWCHADDEVTCAVVQFLASCREPSQMPAAGRALQDFLLPWLDSLGVDIQTARQAAQQQGAAEPDLFAFAREQVRLVTVPDAPPAPVGELHARQDRADAGMDFWMARATRNGARL